MVHSASSAGLLVVTESVSDVDEFIQNFLRPCLPYSLPLLRRCQFHQRQIQPNPSAEIRVFGILQPSAEQDSWKATNGPVEVPKAGIWLAAHIDLTVSGQTQVWTYASWEPDFAAVADPGSAARNSAQYAVHQTLFQALFKHIQEHHIVKLSPDPPEQWLRLKREGKILSEPFSRSKVLFGTLAECLWPFLDQYSVVERAGVTRSDRGYLKFIVKSSRTEDSSSAPDGFQFAPMEGKHLQTIIDRTNIPRTIETLKQLPNIGLIDTNKRPIAWGLIGKDASISSLHTEPEYRGRGLAEIVARQLIREQIKFFGEGSSTSVTDETVVYSHADVSQKNIASRRVLEKIGGEVKWSVAWIEIDLGEV